MPHLDQDRLTLIAVGESEGDERETAHLGDCALCCDELHALREVVTRATEAPRLRDLPRPPERVWRRIAGEVQARQQPGPAPVHDAAPRPRVPGWARLVAVAAAAVVLAAGATLGATQLVQQPEEEQPAVTARASLAATGTASDGASGQARVLDDGTLHLHVTGLTDPSGYYEVWLIDPDTMEMVSIGVLGDGEDVLLPLPPTVDLSVFRLVDISLEQYGGEPGHSGDTLVRGTLSQ